VHPGVVRAAQPIVTALFSSSNTNAAMNSAEQKCNNLESATVGTMRLVGQMLSLGISTLLFSILIGRVPITPENHPQFLNAVHLGFGISTLLCFAGIFISLARGRVR
jgi:hypothetical protein